MLTQFQLSALKWAQEVSNSKYKRKGKKPVDSMPFWKSSAKNGILPYPTKPKRSQRKHWLSTD